jgi:hypothetical protein
LQGQVNKIVQAFANRELDGNSAKAELRGVVQQFRRQQ